MEHHQLLNPKKRVLREWTVHGAAAMDQVVICILFVRQIEPTTLASSEIQCRFDILFFFHEHVQHVSILYRNI